MVLFHYKIVYLLIHGFILGIGLYKLYTIGLLPLNAADWIDLVPNHEVTLILWEISNKKPSLPTATIEDE